MLNIGRIFFFILVAKMGNIEYHLLIASNILEDKFIWKSYQYLQKRFEY